LKYRKLAIKLKLKDIVFAGYVPYEDLPRYYKSADIFCAPATDKESFGLVLLEAMAMGTPTIASDIAGYSAVVDQGVNGLLVRPRDEKALANALLQLLQDKALRESMGSKAELKARDYSWEKVAQQVMSYYDDLLQGHPGKVSEEIACAQQGSTHLGTACE